MPPLAKLADPKRWLRYAASRLEGWRRNRGDDALDRVATALGPVKLVPGKQTIVADGMWSNPNHFLRLRLFIEALSSRGSFHLLGVLRRRSDWRERRALERIGFKDFVYIDETEALAKESFVAEADRLLANVETHADLVNLALPFGLPGYVYFDTVLKLAADPQPPLSNPLWRKTLAEILRNLAVYDRELSGRSVAHVVLSHPWKNEWATLTWLALGRGIPSYHLTGFCEAIRIRRFGTAADYATPVEHLALASFLALPRPVQQQLSDFGAVALHKRAAGGSSDLNARYAFDPAHRIEDRAAARMALSGQTEKPVVVIYGHVWYDFPHAFAMRHFSDFLDWIRTTLDAIRGLDDVIWLLKPHPTEQWYGGFSLAEAAQDLPRHIRVLPNDTDSQTAVNAADAIVTVHGTIALEAAANGVAVIVADRSYFSDWQVAHVAKDRADYLALLGRAGRLSAPDADAINRARACFALALGEPPAAVDALQMSCDSSGAKLYKEISARYLRERPKLVQEAGRIGAFFDQAEIDSFAAYHLVETARRVAADRLAFEGRTDRLSA